MDEYGVDAIAALIEESGWSYPVSSRRLLNEHALRNIEIDAKGNSVMVGEVVDPSDIREFTSESDLERKLTPTFEQLRAKRQTGVLGWVRRHFP